MRTLTLISLLLLTMPAQAQTQRARTVPPQQGLRELVSERTNRIDTYVRVPLGQTYEKLQLALKANSDAPANLTVSIDGSYAGTARITGQGQQLLVIPLPALPGGTHRMEVTGTPLTLPERVDPCVIPSLLNLSLTQPRLSYQINYSRDPRINELPDALYPRDLSLPAVGQLQVDAQDPQAVSALLTLAQAVGARRPVVFSADPQRLPPEFTLSVVQDAALKVPAQIITSWGNLTVRYKDAAGLKRAVNALTNRDYRDQLNLANWNATRNVPAPQAASLPKPTHLSDFGLIDFQVMQGLPREDVLTIPPAWVASGVPTGTVHLAAPAGLSRSARFWGWINNEVVVSRDISHLDDQATRLKVNVRGSRPFTGNTVPLRWQSDVTGPEGCVSSPQTGVWVNALDSTLDFNLKPRGGLGALNAKLLSKGTVRAQTPAELALAGTMLANLPLSGVRGAVPIQVVNTEDATLSIQTTNQSGDQSGTDPDEARVARPEQGVTLTRSGERFVARAMNEQALGMVARQWPRLAASLPGNWQGAFASQEGEWVPLNAAPTESQPVAGRQYGQLGYVALGVLLALTLPMFLLSRSRRKDQVK